MLEKAKQDKVFYISIASLIVFIIFALGNITRLEQGASVLVAKISEEFAWFYILAIALFIAVCLYMLGSKYRNVRLGKDEERPEYSYKSWFAMLFSAGMGIGLVFFGVAEPLTHYVNPLAGEGLTDAAQQFALAKSFLHWGISAWAVYVVLALVLAYFQYRKDKPMLMSAMLEPIIGEKRAKGTLGIVINVFTIFATIAGIVSSLGLGTMQINGGLNYLFGIPMNIVVQFTIIALITVCFIISAVSGIDKGVQRISNMNMVLASVLLIMAFLVGPTGKMIANFMQGLIGYGPEFVRSMDPTVSGEWYGQWTIYYWANWICWAPPVAIFIARISRGRTIKEFVSGVLIVPSILCLIWFSVFGTLAMEVSSEVAMEAVLVTETALFKVVEQYPLGGLISIIAIVLIGTFFITSADSTTFVLGMLGDNGNKNPSNSKKVVYGLILSVLTVIFLMAGGITLIQNVSIIMALPFTFVMFGCIASFIKVLKEEKVPEVLVENKGNKKVYKEEKAVWVNVYSMMKLKLNKATN